MLNTIAPTRPTVGPQPMPQTLGRPPHEGRRRGSSRSDDPSRPTSLVFAPSDDSPHRPTMGVIYTNRHARRHDTAPEPDEEEEEDSTDTEDDSTHPRADASAARPLPDARNQSLLKNLRPRLVYLRSADRILLELALTGERSKRDIARTIGIEPGNVTRRLDRLIRRLSSGLVNALLAEGCPLRPELRQLALEHFLGDQSQRELADLHHMTPGAVSRALQYVRGWYGEGKSTSVPTGEPQRARREKW